MTGSSIKTREQMLKEIRERNEKAPSYWDWWYNILEVDVCDIDTGDGRVYRVPKYIGEGIADTIRDDDTNNKLIPLGEILIRAYMIRRMEFKKERFTSMSDWAKGMLLKQNPELLSEHEKDFSPRLKEHLAEIKKGNGVMKALPLALEF